MDNAVATLITGASSGIGEAVARRLAKTGRPLVLCGRNVERLQSVAVACRAEGAACEILALDLRDPTFAAQVTRLDELRPIGRLICNAGVLDGRRSGAICETAAAAQDVLTTNLLAAVGVVQTVLPLMIARGAGEIALVSSLAGLAPLADAPSYSASKAGLIAYGLGLRDAVSSTGVRVVVVCPGYVETGMSRRHQGRQPGRCRPEAAADAILAALRSDRALSGFPLPLYWAARLALLAPNWVRRMASRGLRFHVGACE